MPNEGNTSDVTAVFDLDLVREYAEEMLNILSQRAELTAEAAEIRERFQKKNLDTQSVDKAIAIARARAKAKASPETVDGLVYEIDKKIGAHQV